MNSRQKKAYQEAVERDNGLCRVCGAVAADIHHIVFRSHGGAHVSKNLICLCMKHHEEAHFDEKVQRDKLIKMQEAWYGEKISIKELKKGGNHG